MEKQVVEIVPGKTKSRFKKFLYISVALVIIILIIVIIVFTVKKKNAILKLKKNISKTFNPNKSNIKNIDYPEKSQGQIKDKKKGTNYQNKDNLEINFSQNISSDSFFFSIQHNDIITINYVDENDILHPLTYCLECWVDEICDGDHLCFAYRKNYSGSNWIVEQYDENLFVFRNQKNGKLLNVVPEELTGKENGDLCCVDLSNEGIITTQWKIFQSDDQQQNAFYFKNAWNGLYLNICENQCVDSYCQFIPKTKNKIMKFIINKLN